MSSEELIGKGRYRARASDWALGTSSKGNVQIGIAFELLDFPGYHITWYGAFTDDAMEYTVKAMRTCGWQGCDLGNDEELRQLSANEVSITIDHELYNGQLTAKVKWVNAAGGVAMKNMLAGNDRKAFASKMRGAILAMDPGSAQQRAAASARPAANSAQPNRAPQQQRPSAPQGYGAPMGEPSDDVPF